MQFHARLVERCSGHLRRRVRRGSTQRGGGINIPPSLQATARATVQKLGVRHVATAAYLPGVALNVGVGQPLTETTNVFRRLQEIP